MLTFWIYPDKKGEWRWRLESANNEIIADSAEGYKEKRDCVSAIEIIRKGAATATVRVVA